MACRTWPPRIFCNAIIGHHGIADSGRSKGHRGGSVDIEFVADGTRLDRLSVHESHGWKEIALDTSALDGDEVELVWSYEPDPALFCFSLGDVRRLPSGNTLVDFSVKGQVDEVTPDGDVVWRLTLGMGGALGYMTWLEDLYSP